MALSRINIDGSSNPNMLLITGEADGGDGTGYSFVDWDEIR